MNNIISAKNVVVFVDHSPKIGGAARMLANLTASIDRDKISPIIVCPPGSENAADFRKKGMRVETTTMPWLTKKAGIIELLLYPWHLLAFAAFLIKLSRAERISLIHANNFVSFLYCIVPSVLLQVPSLWHMQDILDLSLINKICARIAGSAADRIICVSEAVKKSLIDFGVEESKCTVIYNYLSDTAGKQQRPDLSDELLIAKNTNVVGIIGNICLLKGQLVFLYAVPSILQAFPNTVFLIIGDSTGKADEAYKQNLREYIQRHGLEKQVMMTGFKKNILDIVEKLDVLVHPPVLPEAFGLVLLEAMYKEKPVVASNIGGIPELVQDTVNGFLIPPNDSDALAQAVCKLLSDPQLRTRMGAQGKKICLEQFSQKNFIDKFNLVYRELTQVAPFRYFN